jgi:hypothetical protein
LSQSRVSDELLASVDPEWFWSNVRRGAPEVCWPWTGETGHYGYGVVYFRAQGQRTGAHRVAYVLATGNPLGDLEALHHCDNPPCCNPGDLWAGTQQDNMADAASKGRSRNGARRITDFGVAELRRRYGLGESATDLAAEFGIGRRQVLRLATGVSQRHGPGEIVLPQWKADGYRLPVKLTNTQVAEIRERYATGGITQRALATAYDTDQAHVCRIINGQHRK